MSYCAIFLDVKLTTVITEDNHFFAVLRRSVVQNRWGEASELCPDLGVGFTSRRFRWASARF